MLFFSTFMFHVKRRGREKKLKEHTLLLKGTRSPRELTDFWLNLRKAGLPRSRSLNSYTNSSWTLAAKTKQKGQLKELEEQTKKACEVRDIYWVLSCLSKPLVIPEIIFLDSERRWEYWWIRQCCVTHCDRLLVYIEGDHILGALGTWDLWVGVTM